MSTTIAKNYQVGSDSTATNNFTIRQPATPDGTVRIANGNSGTTTDLVTVTSAGNVGVGTTPSAWAASNRFIDINASASYGAFGSTDSMMLANAYWNGSNWIRKNANNAWRMVMESTSGAPSWTFQYAGNSTAGSTISWSEAMRLDSSGNLGLGVTPSAWTTFTSALEVPGGALSGISANQVGVWQNCFYNSSSFKYKSTNGATLYQQAGSAHAWYTAPSGTAGNTITFTQAMTLDASGNLGIGVTSPAALLHIASSTVDPEIRLVRTPGSGNINTIKSDLNDLTFTSGRNLLFTAGGSERARITSGGDLLVGTTSGQVSATVVAYRSSAAVACVGPWNAATSGDNLFVVFNTEATATQRGSIDYNRAGGLTRYNTTSDYRAKDIIGPVQNSGATIDALKVYEGVMKGATQSRPMLIAHEAQEHAPYAVSGVKDEVNEDGTPKFQQMDVSSLVPLLLAEIQSLRARVAALESNP